MNEKILEIAKQSGLTVNAEGEISCAYYGSISDGYKKFAEHIIRECASFADTYNREMYGRAWCDGKAVKSHFGIE